MPTAQTWIITTSGKRPLTAIADELTEAGFSVQQVMDQIGCITGTADAATAEKLRGITGVDDVSPDQPIDLGSPDEKVSW